MAEMTAPKTNDPEVPKLGAHSDVPFDDYLRAPGASKHDLDLIHKSPATYAFEKYNPPPSTPAMVFGSALHTLVLEPDKFDKIYIPDEFGGSQSKEAKAYRATAAAQGLIVINTKADAEKKEWGISDWDKLHRMAEAVQRNPIASAFLTDIMPELSFWWVDKETRALCRARVDGYSKSHTIALDLKTAADATYSGFSRAVHEYRYDVQDAYYQDGLRACGHRVDGFIFIVVEKQPPYLTACYTLAPEWREQGRTKYRHDLRALKECVSQDEWEGLPELRDLELPSFAKFNKIS